MSKQATTERGNQPECLLPAEEQREHLNRLSDTVLDKVEATEELEDGYAFVFEFDPPLARTLLERVFIERECCPFYDMDLTFERDGGPMRFSFHGPEGTKRMMREQLAKSDVDLGLEEEASTETQDSDEGEGAGCGCGFC